MKSFFRICITIIMTILSFACSNDNDTYSAPTDETDTTSVMGADLVVYGKIYTAETNDMKAFAVKDGKYVYVGDSIGAKAYIDSTTKILNYSYKGLVMPSCGNGHAHYMMGYGFSSVGATIGSEDDVDKFFQIITDAVAKARTRKSTVIFGFGWNYHIFKENMPTRQQLDSICSDIPMFFSDEEGHKGLVNTLCLKKAGILSEDGKLLKGKDAIRGGEIVMGNDELPTGLLLEQAGTYTRSTLDNEKLYTVETARKNLKDIEQHLLSEGYTMYQDGWSNYFFNNNFYMAAQQLDEANEMNFILGLSHEIESWMDVSSSLSEAIEMKSYASKHVLPQWVKLFIDGTVEGGTGYCSKLYPDGHQGIINWKEQEVADITHTANVNDLSMHIHTMGDKAVNLAVNAYISGGQDDKRNTIVHVRNVMDEDWQRMAQHNIYATSGMLWHHYIRLAPLILWMYGMVPEGFETMSYPMKSYFNYGINVSSHTDFPALSGSPDDPFGIMEIAVMGVKADVAEYQDPWWEAELLSREQALQALTINCAKQMFIEKERGSIKVGKYADFLLVNKDVLTCPMTSIHQAKVAATYFEGRKVYGKNFEE